MTIAGDFTRFRYFNFKTSFLKNEHLFLKTGIPFFLVETTKIESTTFPYKTNQSKADVKTNRMMNIKTKPSQGTEFRHYLLFFEKK